MHSNSCALTAQKDKVWSCSEFEQIELNQATLNNLHKPERELELV